MTTREDTLWSCDNCGEDKVLRYPYRWSAVAHLKACGVPVTAIAIDFGVTRSQIYNILKQAREAFG